MDFQTILINSLIVIGYYIAMLFFLISPRLGHKIHEDAHEKVAKRNGCRLDKPSDYGRYPMCYINQIDFMKCSERQRQQITLAGPRATISGLIMVFIPPLAILYLLMASMFFDILLKMNVVFLAFILIFYSLKIPKGFLFGFWPKHTYKGDLYRVLFMDYSELDLEEIGKL